MTEKYDEIAALLKYLRLRTDRENTLTVRAWLCGESMDIGIYMDGIGDIRTTRIYGTDARDAALDITVNGWLDIVGQLKGRQADGNPAMTAWDEIMIQAERGERIPEPADPGPRCDICSHLARRKRNELYCMATDCFVTGRHSCRSFEKAEPRARDMIQLAGWPEK